MKILIIGGNRFFGRHLASKLVQAKHEVTLMNRGNIDDGFGSLVQRLQVNRQDREALARVTQGQQWDLVFDQICYTSDEALMACQIFNGKTRRYVLTSSASVYDEGENLHESKFDPMTYRFTTSADRYKEYSEAKRQVESAFSQQGNFSLAIVRPSYVIGVDDYTDRLKWHIERIARGLPIYFPNMQARSDFILSEQAADVLFKVGLSSYCGPVNCSTAGSISRHELIAICERIIGKKAVLTHVENEHDHSPYGAAGDNTLDLSRLKSLGYTGTSSFEWLPGLISQIYEQLSYD